MKNQLNRNSSITSEVTFPPVLLAMKDVRRDIENTCLPSELPGTPIVLAQADLPKEVFELYMKGNELRLCASDALGFIYGLYHISREILGVQDFWFWNDQKFAPQEGYMIPDDIDYRSQPYPVKLRGWFINDEVLLSTWSLNHKKDLPWQMAFEALLRCGGNMVIPGTDDNARRYRNQAAQRGLAITHHHAEPLGAEMFARAFPDKEASYDTYPDLFQQLWHNAIREQTNLNVVWNLGFRGQGDYPFWENNPNYSTQEKRGALMSSLIELQYQLVKQNDLNAVCCTNLYGETMELYQQGVLHLPKDIIRIWADNGFGKMVTRRQGNYDPRIPALPQKGDGGRHGLYYHVSFYDLQAASHMTMLASAPELVKSELDTALQLGVRDYWIINCSNIKPHTYYLDFIATLWRRGSIEIRQHQMEYALRYYHATAAPAVAKALQAYFKTSMAYGPFKDQKAGEQFTNHIPRILISSYMKHTQAPAEELFWACDRDSLAGQIQWFLDTCSAGVQGYRDYEQFCMATNLSLTGDDRIRFEDSLLLQATLRKECAEGAIFVCRSLQYALQKEYQKAFFLAGKARKCYLTANNAMRDREHGKWRNYYENECLVDIKQTAWVLQGLMSYLRNWGDGPHFYQWQRDFLYSRENARVMLLMNKENHLADWKLYELMETRWDDELDVIMQEGS